MAKKNEVGCKKDGGVVTHLQDVVERPSHWI